MYDICDTYCHEKIFFKVLLDTDLIFIPALYLTQFKISERLKWCFRNIVFPQSAAQFNPLTHKKKNINHYVSFLYIVTICKQIINAHFFKSSDGNALMDKVFTEEIKVLKKKQKKNNKIYFLNIII